MGLKPASRDPQQGQQVIRQKEETTGLVVKKELNSFEEKMRTKSKKIVEAAERGELKEAVDKCKKFLSTIQASTFECKCELNSWEEIEGVEQFGEIVDNIGKILKLPEENINGIKLAAGGKGAKRDTLAFECAMKDNGTVRLHTGGYQVEKHTTDQGDRIDFQIALHYLDMKDITFNKLPLLSRVLRRNGSRPAKIMRHSLVERGRTGALNSSTRLIRIFSKSLIMKSDCH